MNTKSDIRIYFCRNAVNVNDLPAALADLELRDDVTLEPVPCGGRIDPRYLLKAFESGTQAVCILTCPMSHCKLMEGNLRATRRVQMVREMLTESGLDPSSLQIFLPESLDESDIDAATKAVAKFVEGKRQLTHTMALR